MYQPIDSPPCSSPDRAEALADLVERRLPVDPLEGPVGPAPLRVEDPVGIVLDLGHRDPLRAGEAARQRVLLVGAELRDAAVLDGRDHPAERLADPAVGDVLGGGHRPWPRSLPGSWRMAASPPRRAMRILYGVNGEGMGHATRSQVVVESLLERHEVHVVASGAAYAYLSGVLPDVEEILGAKFVMEDGEIRRWATVRQNLADAAGRRADSRSGAGSR